jgi:hypothetical protein
LEEACLRYDLSVEELFGWERVLDQHGHPRLAGHQAAGLPQHRKRRVRPKGALDDGRQ